MRPILVTLGPWGPVVLPLLFAGLLALLLLWQWLDGHRGGFRGLTVPRVGAAFLSAAVMAALLGSSSTVSAPWR